MVSAAWLFIVILVCLLAIEYKEYQWRKERQDFLNRLTNGESIPSPVDIAEKPPPRGGNMITAGLKRAAKQQMDALQTKEGDS